MSFTNVLEYDDILQIISVYLPLDSKIILGRVCKTNFLRFYDFECEDFKLKKLYDLFVCHDFDIGDMVWDMREYLLDKYIECYRRFYVQTKLQDVDWDSDDESNDDVSYDTDQEEAMIIEKACGMPLKKFLQKIQYCRQYTRFDNIFEEDLEYLLFRTLYTVYIRCFIEHIENNNIMIKYDKNMNIFTYDIWDAVDKHYTLAFEKQMNIDIFCSRCGHFGHDNVSRTCLFFNEEFETKEINGIVNDVIDNIIDDAKNIVIEKRKVMAKALAKCSSNKCNNAKSNKCKFLMCKACCKSPECFYHNKAK